METLNKEQIEGILSNNSFDYERFTSIDTSGMSNEEIALKNDVIDARNEFYNSELFDQIRDQLKVIPRLAYHEAEEQREITETEEACPVEAEEPAQEEKQPFKLEFYKENADLLWRSQEHEVLVMLNNIKIQQGYNKGNGFGDAIASKARGIHMHRQLIQKDVNEHNMRYDYCGAPAIIEAIYNVVDSFFCNEDYFDESHDDYIQYNKKSAEETVYRVKQLTETAIMLMSISSSRKAINECIREIEDLQSEFSIKVHNKVERTDQEETENE